MKFRILGTAAILAIGFAPLAVHLARADAPVPKTVALGEDTIRQVAGYLQERPYKEVANLLSRIQWDIDHQPKPIDATCGGKGCAAPSDGAPPTDGSAAKPEEKSP